MGGCFAENRHVVVYWKQLGKEAYDVLLERTLERAHDVWKGINITQQTVDDTVWYWFTLPLFAGHCVA